MKKIILLTFLFASINVFAQQQTFDIITFTAPADWEKKTSEAAIQFMKDDTATGGYCVLTLFKAVPAAAGAKENFSMAWTSLVKDMINAPDIPQTEQTTTEDGYEVITGHANFEREGIKGVCILVSSVGFGKTVNIIIMTNTDVFEKQISGFLESISIQKNEASPVVGTWGISNTIASFYDMNINEGNILTQYTFNADGTYTFYVKTFQYQVEHLLFTRESGKYHISGDQITIEPQKSATEAWTKKEGADNWGKFVSTQKRALEKTTYQFHIERFETGSSLVLKAAKPTKRDGPFNNSGKDAWFYPSKSGKEIIQLPGTASAGGYSFNTTNFDDGWTSTIHEDWVQVTKAATRVLIHYPSKQADEYQTDLAESIKNAWKVLVAPRYTAGEVEFKPVRGWESIEWAQADAVEIATGKNVNVVLFKKNYSGGTGKYIEFITPAKENYEQEFGGSDWDKLAAMANYNKFAVAASDLGGKWAKNFSGTTQYVNVYTGLSAGMDTHSSNQIFQFGPGDDYKWEIAVASGMVGNIKFDGAKSAGRFAMKGNWQIHFSDIEGKPKTYDVAFSCVKGARILWVDGTPFFKQ